MKKQFSKKDLEKIAAGKGEDTDSAVILACKFASCKNLIDAIRILIDAKRLPPENYNTFKMLVDRMTGIDVDQLLSK